MRNLHNIERRGVPRSTFMSGHPYIGYGKTDNFYIKRASKRSHGWVAQGFTKGTMRATHLLCAPTLTELSAIIAKFH